MAGTTTKTTTPRRAAARKPPVAKQPAPAAEETAPAKTDPVGKATLDKDENGAERLTVELDYLGDTKTYSKFGVPEDYRGVGLTGTIYAPHGTDTVKLLVVTPT